MDREVQKLVPSFDSLPVPFPEKVTYKGFDIREILLLNDADKDKPMSFAIDAKGELVLSDGCSVNIQYMSGGDVLTDPFNRQKGSVRMIIQFTS